MNAQQIENLALFILANKAEIAVLSERLPLPEMSIPAIKAYIDKYDWTDWPEGLLREILYRCGISNSHQFSKRQIITLFQREQHAPIHREGPFTLGTAPHDPQDRPGETAEGTERPTLERDPQLAGDSVQANDAGVEQVVCGDATIGVESTGGHGS